MKKNRIKTMGFSLTAAMLMSAVPFQTLQAEEADEFELMPNSVSIQSYLAEEGRVDVYGSFTEFVNESGTAGELNDSMLLMKRGEIVPVSTQFEFIHERPDQVLVDTITGDSGKTQYLSVLTERRVLEDYYTKLQWPEELRNAGIAEISSSLDSSDPVVMVRYTDRSAAAFNYVTGNLLFLDESEKESVGFGEYVQNWLTETADKLFSDENTGYEDSKAVIADAVFLAEADRENAVWKGGSGIPDGLLEEADGKRGVPDGLSGESGMNQGTAGEEQSEHRMPQKNAENPEAVPAEEGYEQPASAGAWETAGTGETAAVAEAALEPGAVLEENGAPADLTGGETAPEGIPADLAGGEPAPEGVPTDSAGGVPEETADAPEGMPEAPGTEAEVVTADGQILTAAEYMERRETKEEPPRNTEETSMEPEAEAAGTDGSSAEAELLAKASDGGYVTAYDPVSGTYEVYEQSEYLREAGNGSVQSVGEKLAAAAEAGNYKRLSETGASFRHDGRGWLFVLAAFGGILLLLGGLLGSYQRNTIHERKQHGKKYTGSDR